MANVEDSPSSIFGFETVGQVHTAVEGVSLDGSDKENCVSQVIAEL